MSNISIERVGVHVRNLFKVLLENPDESVRARDAIARTAANIELTDFEGGEYESGGRRFDKILHFATIDLVKAGWMDKEAGLWSVTEAGKEAYERLKDPRDFYKEAKTLYRAWSVEQVAEDEQNFESTDLEESASVTYEESEERAWSQITNHLFKIPPYDVQRLVKGLLEAMKYHVMWVAPPGKDGGTDLIAFTDPLGTKFPRIRVQVKRQQVRTSTEEIRAFMAILGREDVGIFFAVGGFTRDAEREARQQDRHKITLLDLKTFFGLWLEHYKDIPEEAKNLLRLKPVWFLAPDKI